MMTEFQKSVEPVQQCTSKNADIHSGWMGRGHHPCDCHPGHRLATAVGGRKELRTGQQRRSKTINHAQGVRNTSHLLQVITRSIGRHPAIT